MKIPSTKRRKRNLFANAYAHGTKRFNFPFLYITGRDCAWIFVLILEKVLNKVEGEGQVQAYPTSFSQRRTYSYNM